MARTAPVRFLSPVNYFMSRVRRPPRMADMGKSTMSQVRKTISTSLAAAFGFVIALLWNGVVTSGLTLAGVSTTAPADAVKWAIFVVTAGVLALRLVGPIISRGGPPPDEPRK